MRDNIKRINEIVTSVDDEFKCFMGSISTPIFETTIFKIDDFDTAERFTHGEIFRYSYSRNQNPTTDMLCSLISKMEKSEAAMALASGTSAIYTALLYALKCGDHVVMEKNAYGRALGFIQNEFARFGVEYTLVDGRDTNNILNAIRDNTSLIYLESPNSWLFDLQDFRAVTAVARERGILTIADNTYSTPVFQNPIEMGVDIVVHSATKYLGGHSTTIGGLLASSKEIVSNLPQVEAKLSAHEGAKLISNMRTLPLRMMRHESNAQQVVAYLEKHPKVVEVKYPGSPNHPQAELVKAQMHGASGLISFVLDCDRPGMKRFIDSLRHISIAGSWGSYESVIWSTDFNRDFAQQDEFTTLKAHQCRVSLGLEEADLLLSDIDAALRSI